MKVLAPNHSGIIYYDLDRRTKLMIGIILIIYAKLLSMITYNQLNIHHVFFVADMNLENSVYDQKRVTCNQTADKIDPKYFIAD